MHSRAYILLQRDFRELKYSNYEGIKAVPVSEDMMKWKAEIKGLQNSIWHGSVLQLTINFTPEYNRVPPVVKFTVVPFHPNVDPSSGQPCIDFLDDPDKWNKRYTLGSILLALQVMLSNPMLENPVNLKAAQMLVKDESKYKRIIEALFLPSKCRHHPSLLSVLQLCQCTLQKSHPNYQTIQYTSDKPDSTFAVFSVLFFMY